ncbi:MAG: aminopeptidase P family protein [Pseudomonadota bacterium]
MAQLNQPPTTFQNFDAPQERVAGDERLTKLRDVMRDHGVDIYLVPHADEQRNEYLPACAERLAYISGFTGSAGEAIITLDRAVVFVDGRYTLQGAKQTDASHWTVESLIELPPHAWLKANLDEGQTVGFDPALHTINEVKRFEIAAEAAGAKLKPLPKNLVDAIWEDRPAPPASPVTIHRFEFCGKTTAQKMEAVAANIADNKADLCVLSDAASVCWLFNIRGSDVAHTPLALSHAVLNLDGLPQLFIDENRLDMETKAFLTQVADVRPSASLEGALASLAKDRTVQLDPDHSSQTLKETVTKAGGTVVHGKDPVSLPRAQKNQTEIEGSRAAHIRDGAAMTCFLHWLIKQRAGTVDEIRAAQRLEQFRADMAGDHPLRDISFDTISGSGPNGAIVHYRVTEETNRTLQAGELYLVDSGGQYDDGTTDITRTIAILEPKSEANTEHRLAYTLVLKGHIALALARFPAGTRGVDLDVLARNALWQHGMDYAHGTGHGVGSYLSVHEGPQNISRRGMQPLLPGMIISNEPGYYRAGAFGVRLENLVLVSGRETIEGGEIMMHGFETLTLAPFDNRLIDPILLTDQELHWLNAYHGWVLRTLAPLVPHDTAQWLEQATQPLSKELPAASA